MLKLPDQPGTYALLLRVDAPVSFLYRAQLVQAPAGRYVYVGSARGPGGVHARLGRHIRGAGRPRWHIDALRAVAHVEGWVYTLSSQALECAWVQSLLSRPGVYVPWPRFGASDCHQSCPAHLLAVPDELDLGQTFPSVWTG